MSAATFRLRIEATFGAFALSVELESSAQRLGLFGPSGAGKTSLLETVAGWRTPRAGRIEVGGRTLFDPAQGVALAPERRGLGYVPQDGLLFPHRDVRANLVAGARRAQGRTQGPSGDAPASFERVVEVLELGSLLERTPVTLSGGERQRVALGRALCSGPDALLLDEPLASLDLALRRRILPYLVRVGEEFALPMLYVSHDPTELAVLCDEVAHLAGGRVLGLGRPADLFASAWRDRSLPEAPRNVLRGTVSACREDVARIALTDALGIDVSATGLVPGERVVLTLAADEILVALRKPEGLSARNILAAVVTELTAGPAGVVLRARLEPEGPELDVLLSRASTAALALAPGKELFLVLKSNAVHVLSALPSAERVG